MRGSKPGERRGGRKPGVPNKATAEIKDLARQHTAPAMKELARLSLHAESEQARVGAIKEIFDRGFGRAHQTAEVTHIAKQARELTDDELARVVAGRGGARVVESPVDPTKLN